MDVVGTGCVMTTWVADVAVKITGLPAGEPTEAASVCVAPLPNVHEPPGDPVASMRVDPLVTLPPPFVTANVIVTFPAP